jgi:hypothetical protein
VRDDHAELKLVGGEKSSSRCAWTPSWYGHAFPFVIQLTFIADVEVSSIVLYPVPGYGQFTRQVPPCVNTELTVNHCYWFRLSSLTMTWCAISPYLALGIPCSRTRDDALLR